MKILWRKIILIFIFLLLCTIIIFLRSSIYAYLIDPLAQVSWLIVRSLLSFDQEILWIILIILVSVEGILIFPNGQQNKIRSSYLSSSKVDDRFSYWKMKFQSADKNTYASDSLQQNLENISVSIMDLHRNTKRCEFFIPILKTKPWHLFLVMSKSFFNRISQKSDSFLDSELERNLNQILDSMESLMEVQND